MAEKLSSKTADTEFEHLFIKPSIRAAEEYIAALESGSEVDEQIEIFRGYLEPQPNIRNDENRENEDSEIFNDLFEEILSMLDSNVEDFGIITGDSSSEVIELFSDSKVELVKKYELGPVDSDGQAIAEEFSLILAKPGTFNKEDR